MHALATKYRNLARVCWMSEIEKVYAVSVSKIKKLKKSKYCLTFQMFLLFWGPLARPFALSETKGLTKTSKYFKITCLHFCIFSWNQITTLKSYLEIKNQKLRFGCFQRKKNYLLSEELQWTFLCIIAKIQKNSNADTVLKNIAFIKKVHNSNFSAFFCQTASSLP